MTIKKYIIKGVVEGYYPFRFGTSTIRLNFRGGSLNSEGLCPAMYQTSDEVIQTIIEESEMFLSGKIELSQELRLDEAKDESSSNDKSEEKPKVYSEVSNLQQARNILMNEYGISLRKLQNKEQVKEMARINKVEFPAWV